MHLLPHKDYIESIFEDDNLTRGTLADCRNAIQTAMENNVALVESAKLHASSGKTGDILQTVLTRIDNCIKRFEDEELAQQTRAGLGRF